MKAQDNSCCIVAVPAGGPDIVVAVVVQDVEQAVRTSKNQHLSVKSAVVGH